jgi:hypothetical protein
MDFIGQMVSENLGGYESRCDKAVHFLAQICGYNADEEVSRFKRLMETMGQVATTDGPLDPNNPFAALQAKVIQAMPPVVEFVTTHAASKLQGFGYLTEGRPGHDLPSTLMAKLENTFRICLSDGGGVDDGEILADTFRLVFPDLGLLENHSPLAQAMLMGFVPGGEKVDLKAYFNTRLGGTNHEELVQSLLERLNLDGEGFYGRLYASQTQARFVGVGVDLHGDATRRAKLYVRVPRTELMAALENLCAGQTHLNIEDIKREAALLIDTAQCKELSDEVEIAISLRSDSPPTVKLTVFFTSDEMSAEPEQCVMRYLESKGYDSAVFTTLFDTMKQGVSDPGVKKQPVHGLGIEFPVEEQVKINTYFNPLV